MSRRVGRPPVKRAPNERFPVSVRIRGEIFNRLVEAAELNNRPFGNEVELRLEQSFEPFPTFTDFRRGFDDGIVVLPRRRKIR
jgi:hypothetical protein